MNIRKPAVAGQFYPKDRVELESVIKKYFEESKIELSSESKIMGIISPHAGYIFSGMQSAKAYKYILGKKYKTVCVISPSHQEYFEGCSVYSGDFYETPLGQIKIDDKLRSEIEKFAVVKISEAGHRSEHALEVQLPFLQMALSNDFLLIPIVIGSQNDITINKLNEVVRYLKEKMRDEILFVASSDLSHFHDYETANLMDNKLVKLISQYDYKNLWKDIQANKIEACGAGPIVAMMKGLDNIKNRKIKSLGYMNSGDVISDKSRVVGYTSAILLEEG